MRTIGDAVMATFPTPDRAVAAALRMREAMDLLNQEHKTNDLILKIGIHEGPCLAVMENGRQDYFGRAVNVAARVQDLAVSRGVFATESVVENPRTSRLLETRNIRPLINRATLRGISGEITVYEIP